MQYRMFPFFSAHSRQNLICNSKNFISLGRFVTAMKSHQEKEPLILFSGDIFAPSISKNAYFVEFLGFWWDECDVIVWVRKLSFRRRHSKTDQKTHQCRDKLIFSPSILPTNYLTGFITKIITKHRPQLFCHILHGGDLIFFNAVISCFPFSSSANLNQLTNQ